MVVFRTDTFRFYDVFRFSFSVLRIFKANICRSTYSAIESRQYRKGNESFFRNVLYGYIIMAEHATYGLIRRVSCNARRGFLKRIIVHSDGKIYVFASPALIYMSPRSYVIHTHTHTHTCRVFSF